MSDQKEKELLEELKLLLVPPDPLDDRNVIMEIRAGVGHIQSCRQIVRDGAVFRFPLAARLREGGL